MSILHPLRRSSCCLISSSSCSLSTQSIINIAENKTKSPHSKLLRVCSSRNANPHFAGIESEMLRLDWNKAMIKLVADWANNKRFDEFVELEKNVKSYVDKNLQWIQLETETVNHSNENILMNHFPYENIISRFVRYSILASSAEDNASTDKINKQELKSAMGDIQKRMETLATAGKLLKSLSTLETEHTLSDSYNKCCTNCFRMVVSGWFLLFRQHKALNDKIISELNAADILSITSQLKTHPDVEAYKWAEKWISFNSRIEKENLGSYSILSSDKPLFVGISKVLSPETASDFKDKMNQVFTLAEEDRI